MVVADPLKVVELLDEAFNRKDIETVLNFYDDNAVVVLEPGKHASGKNEIRRAFEWIFANIKGTAKQERTFVIEADDIALFLSKWNYSGEDANGTPFSRESNATVVFRKCVDERWRIVIDNSWGLAVLETDQS